MDVLALLDKLDAYLSECSRLPLVGKLVVDEEEVFSIIDDMRAALPQELEQAKWLLKERERIVAEARKESEQILKDAQGQIASLASESVITKEARMQADELIDRAREVARQISVGAREYADEMMGRLEAVLVEMLEGVRQGRKELSVERDDKPKDEEAGTASEFLRVRTDEEDEEEDDEVEFEPPRDEQGKGRRRRPRSD